LRERDHFDDPGIDRRIILRWIFRKWDMGVCTGLNWFRTGDTCECGNKPSGSINAGNFLAS